MWFRNLGQKIFPGFKNYKDEDKARNLAILRVAYFFGASTLAFMLYHKYEQEQLLSEVPVDEQHSLLMGQPVIKDLSPEHRAMRISGVETGIVSIKKGSDYVRLPYNREEYLRDLERAALDRARIAQTLALKEGKELPKGARRLV